MDLNPYNVNCAGTDPHELLEVGPEVEVEADVIERIDQSVLEFMNGILMEEEEEEAKRCKHHHDLHAAEEDPSTELMHHHENLLYKSILHEFYEILARESASKCDDINTAAENRAFHTDNINSSLLYSTTAYPGYDYGHATSAYSAFNSSSPTSIISADEFCSSSSVTSDNIMDQIIGTPWLINNHNNYAVPDEADNDDQLGLIDPNVIETVDTEAGDNYVDDFSFNEEGLKLQEDYEQLYIGDIMDKESRAGEPKKKGGKRKGSELGTAPGYYDLEELLLSCAQAVSRYDIKKAKELLEELHQLGASPIGRTGLHRMAFYFCQALEARINGCGSALYAATLARDIKVSTADTIRALKAVFETSHPIKISHFLANQSIADVTRGCSHVHIINYGIAYGIQWTYVIKALSEREGGPPYLVITGVDFPKPGADDPAVTVKETGRRLAEYARTWKVPFQYHPVASSKWEELDAESLRINPTWRRSQTALVVSSMKRLREIPEESTLQDQNALLHGCGGRRKSTMSPRQKLLCRICSFKPDLFVLGVANAGYNVPIFTTRFKEALQYYSSIYDMLDASTTAGDSPERMLVERRILARGIVNVVACEGVDRVERPETYRHWQARMERAGFQQLPLPPTLLARSTAYVRKRYHPDCTVFEERGSPWLLVGWRGRTFVALSTWKPLATWNLSNGLVTT